MVVVGAFRSPAHVVLASQRHGVIASLPALSLVAILALKYFPVYGSLSLSGSFPPALSTLSFSLPPPPYVCVRVCMYVRLYATFVCAYVCVFAQVAAGVAEETVKEACGGDYRLRPVRALCSLVG